VYNLSRSVFRAGEKASWALIISACLGHVQLAWANNPQVAGSGCVEAGTLDNLGTAPDHLSARTVVSTTMMRRHSAIELQPLCER
jgi:hypothetical protein